MGAMPALQAVLFGSLLAGAVIAQEAASRVDAKGTVTVGPRIPFSVAASPQALERFQEILREDQAAPGIADPLASRKFYDGINSDRARRMRLRYAVEVEHSRLGGVPVDIVTAAGVPSDRFVSFRT
jgi:epsilon-lactone hydrolase